MNSDEKSVLNVSQLNRDYDWRQVYISEVCESIVDCVNKTAPTVDYPTEFKMIRTTNVKNGKIDLSQVKYVNEETYRIWTRRSVPQIGDVILTREAPIGEVGIVKTEDKIFLGQRLMQFRADPQKLNSRFLLYSMKSPFMQRQIQSHEGTGSTVSHIRVPDCMKFKIRLPEKSIQDKIAEVLGKLDDKIELNNSMNKNLEEMAQALFKRWFIDFEFPNENGEPYKSSGGEFVESEVGAIPKGWKITNLANISYILMGQSPKSEFYNNVKEGLPFHQGVRNYSFRYPSEGIYSSQLLRVANKGSILFSVRAPVGRINVADCDIVIGRGLGAFNSKIDCNSYLLYLLKSTFKTEDQHGSGTIFNSITKGELESIKIVQPNDFYIKKYDEIVSVIDNQIMTFSKEINALTNLRDSLLPKLMSGEIRVPMEVEAADINSHLYHMERQTKDLPLVAEEQAPYYTGGSND